MNAKTTVNGASQDLSAGTLVVATTTPFLSSGKFTIAGITGTCSYTNTTDRTKFTGITGCTGTPADGAAIASVGILENGSGTGINHAALQLIYSATVNIHGTSTITATGDVTIASTVNVTGTANSAGAPDKGTWAANTAYSKGDVVTNPSDGKRYDAKQDIDNTHTTSPDADTADWEVADSKDSSVAATVLVATAKSQLSDTSSISATNGNVKITSKPDQQYDDDRGLVRFRLRRRDRRRRRRHRLRGVHRQHERHAGQRQEPDRDRGHGRQHADDGQVEPERLEGQRHERQRPDEQSGERRLLGAVAARPAARPTASRRPPTGTRTSAPRSP